MLTPPVALLGIGTAIMQSPWFSFSENALSDLGISNAANIFNATLIISGLLSMFMATGMLTAFRGETVKRAGAAIFILAGAALVCIGVFHEGYSPHHYIFSVMFFVLMPIAIMTISLPMLIKAGTRKLGYLSLAMVFIAIIAWVIPWGMGIAVPEAIAAAAGCRWIIVSGARLYLGSDDAAGKL